MTNEEAIKILKFERGYFCDFKGCQEQQAFTMAIKALEQTRWIPVNEGLPKTDTDVLVTNGIGMYIGWIDPTDKKWRVDSDIAYLFDDQAIAWMPLPTIYQGEENG